VEKLVHSKLLVPAANRRIQTIDHHISLVRLGIYYFDPHSRPSRLAPDSWQMDDTLPIEHKTGPRAIATIFASPHFLRFVTFLLSAIIHVSSPYDAGAGGLCKPLCTGIYPLLFRTAIWLQYHTIVTREEYKEWVTGFGVDHRTTGDERAHL
jgi:hypothetical protein